MKYSYNFLSSKAPFFLILNKWTNISIKHEQTSNNWWIVLTIVPERYIDLKRSEVIFDVDA